MKSAFGHCGYACGRAVFKGLSNVQRWYETLGRLPFTDVAIKKNSAASTFISFHESQTRIRVALTGFKINAETAPY